MYDHRHRARSPVQRSMGMIGGVGKRTLTGELEGVEPLEPVQMEGESPRAAAEVHSAAARGAALPTTAMPHGERIQALFGPRQDVSQIQAHVGGDTAAAMGATAYATGQHVVFDRQPDLHTAAHEAAHVVQQAHGVHLAGGVGAVGDAYEQHADAVADRVVAGQSAADLLGPGGGAPGAGAAGAVQRKPEKPTKEQLKNFCGDGKKDDTWVHCGGSADKKPQMVVKVRRSDKNDRPTVPQGGLSDGRGYIWVEVPIGATGANAFYHFYLIRGDGSPIRGGAGLVMAELTSSPAAEREVEVDRSVVDQLDASTRAMIVTDEIDDHFKTKDPKHPVRVLDAGKFGKGVQVRVDYGADEGMGNIEKAKIAFPGRDGAPDLEYEARKTSDHGGSYTDFWIDSTDAVSRIGNLQDSVRRGVATATMIMPTDDKKPKK